MKSASQEQIIDQLKFENRTFKSEITELKKDCDSMGRLIEEEAIRSIKLDDRETHLKELEREMKQLKLEL